MLPDSSLTRFAEPQTLLIDIHTHLHPPKLFKAIRRWFAEHSDWDLKHPTEPAAVAESLRQHKVDRFVFCSYAHKPDMARELNSWLVETAKELDHFGLPLATVHPADPDCAEYYEEALKSGCVGIKIHEDVQRIAIDDPRMAPIHELTVKYNGFVLVHVGPIPFKDDTNNGPARVQSVMERHPRLQIVVAHLGVPDTLRYLEMTHQFPQLRLDTTMALSTKSPLRARIDNAVIEPYAEHILFGSDHPNLPHAYEEEVSAITDLKLSEKNKKLVFDQNARILLAHHI
jgi:uncharacterized protein